MSKLCYYAIIIIGLIVTPNAFAQSFAVKSNQNYGVTGANLDEKLAELLESAEDFGTEANQRLTNLETEFKNRIICESNQGVYLNKPVAPNRGTPQCYIPPSIESMYVKFSCAKVTPTCKSGYTLTNGGLTTSTSGAKAGFPWVLNWNKCGEYCTKKIPYIGCIWRKPLFRHYAFCVKSSNAKFCPPSLNASGNLQGCTATSYNPCAGGACAGVVIDGGDSNVNTASIEALFASLQTTANSVASWRSKSLPNYYTSPKNMYYVHLKTEEALPKIVGSRNFLTSRLSSADPEDRADIISSIAVLDKLKADLLYIKTYLITGNSSLRDIAGYIATLTQLNSILDSIIYQVRVSFGISISVGAPNYVRKPVPQDCGPTETWDHSTWDCREEVNR